ncbi:MAG TPA: ammonium transporter, partial [Planococcus sp. (in: firmicutes)]|nr:ammonium transporter [Planococcus sp. (in: firmicutes)]
AAFIAAWKIGPRIGKYTGNVVNSIPGHNLPLGALGVFILWLGWFGFNGGSTLAADPALVPPVIANTLLAASAGILATASYTRFRYGKIDPSLTMNGALAGLVGITAGAANVSFIGAIVIGLAAGVIMTEAIHLLDAKIRIDDPVGAISVHGIAGIWGTLAIGLFDTSGGLLYGGGAEILGIQVVGVLAVVAWTSIATLGALSLIGVFVPLRVSAEEEETGLDFAEHGSQAYAMQDVLRGSSPAPSSFANRLNQMGEAPSSPKP